MSNQITTLDHTIMDQSVSTKLSDSSNKVNLTRNYLLRNKPNNESTTRNSSVIKRLSGMEIMKNKNDSYSLLKENNSETSEIVAVRDSLEIVPNEATLSNIVNIVESSSDRINTHPTTVSSNFDIVEEISSELHSDDHSMAIKNKEADNALSKKNYSVLSYSDNDDASSDLCLMRSSAILTKSQTGQEEKKLHLYGDSKDLDNERITVNNEPNRDVPLLHCTQILDECHGIREHSDQDEHYCRRVSEQLEQDKENRDGSHGDEKKLIEKSLSDDMKRYRSRSIQRQGMVTRKYNLRKPREDNTLTNVTIEQCIDQVPVRVLRSRNKIMSETQSSDVIRAMESLHKKCASSIHVVTMDSNGKSCLRDSLRQDATVDDISVVTDTHIPYPHSLCADFNDIKPSPTKNSVVCVSITRTIDNSIDSIPYPHSSTINSASDDGINTSTMYKVISKDSLHPKSIDPTSVYRHCRPCSIQESDQTTSQSDPIIINEAQRPMSLYDLTGDQDFSMKTLSDQGESISCPVLTSERSYLESTRMNLTKGIPLSISLSPITTKASVIESLEEECEESEDDDDYESDELDDVDEEEEDEEESSACVSPPCDDVPHNFYEKLSELRRNSIIDEENEEEDGTHTSEGPSERSVLMKEIKRLNISTLRSSSRRNTKINVLNKSSYDICANSNKSYTGTRRNISNSTIKSKKCNHKSKRDVDLNESSFHEGFTTFLECKKKAAPSRSMILSRMRHNLSFVDPADARVTQDGIIRAPDKRTRAIPAGIFDKVVYRYSVEDRANVISHREVDVSPHTIRRRQRIKNVIDNVRTSDSRKKNMSVLRHLARPEYTDLDQYSESGDGDCVTFTNPETGATETRQLIISEDQYRDQYLSFVTKKRHSIKAHCFSRRLLNSNSDTLLKVTGGAPHSVMIVVVDQCKVRVRPYQWLLVPRDVWFLLHNPGHKLFSVVESVSQTSLSS